jgi:hypothetical protein
MQITKLKNAETIAVAADGDTLLIGEMPIDVAARRTDLPVTIDISMTRGGVLTETNGDQHVATVVIPQIQYRLVATGEMDENDQPVYERVAQPLNMAAISVTLWPLKGAK